MALAAAVGAVVVALVVAAVVTTLLGRREVAALDRRLDLVAEAVGGRLAGPGAGTALEAELRPAAVRALADGLVLTVRPADGGVRTAGPAAAAPALPPTSGSVVVDGRDYRVRTVALPAGGVLTVGFARDATDRTLAGFRRAAALLTALAATAAAGLGWLLAGPATRPLRLLRHRTAALGPAPTQAERAALADGPVGRTAETADLVEAVQHLLDRVERARAEEARALQAARDFAAAAGHELRTPLTAMRTDLEVLAGHPDLPADQRAEVLAELRGSQARLEETLIALSHLAAGELAGGRDRAPVELTDLAAQAVAAARRSAPPGVTVDVRLPAGEVTVPGWTAGLRLAVDNLLANALRHAGGSRVELSVVAGPDRVRLVVDDDGAGLPPDEREQVFARFHRGRAATAPGSGLGLALVAQQAGLHGGRAWLEEGPLGGSRAVLELPGGHPVDGPWPHGCAAAGGARQTPCSSDASET
ncbi:HAMP domain-containing sensor histidine kinase [Geodermatophilus sp. DSM 44513]|uniref:sensor histidine kinase n=1 Tax=Geodermatophilus sp. DSM 44513 TaxID=1528104 RepID=UPI0028F72D7D|nr:HAMP domain-containing sensor histidine kinase [Geodermatophilus sp. DSM 44513]WNV77460.1 HAMP domain-containing sensor histidine kinase [Geodermatophilus sp. DSM 44513]